MGTPNREPTEYSRKWIEPSSYIPTIFLLSSWGSLLGVLIKSPFRTVCTAIPVGLGFRVQGPKSGA